MQRSMVLRTPYQNNFLYLPGGFKMGSWELMEIQRRMHCNITVYMGQCAGNTRNWDSDGISDWSDEICHVYPKKVFIKSCLKLMFTTDKSSLRPFRPLVFSHKKCSHSWSSWNNKTVIWHNFFYNHIYGMNQYLSSHDLIFHPFSTYN